MLLSCTTDAVAVIGNINEERLSATLTLDTMTYKILKVPFYHIKSRLDLDLCPLDLKI